MGGGESGPGGGGDTEAERGGQVRCLVGRGEIKMETGRGVLYGKGELKRRTGEVFLGEGWGGLSLNLIFFSETVFLEQMKFFTEFFQGYSI